MFTIVILFFTGVIYDVVGRRKTIVGLFLTGAVSTIGFPVSAPSKLWFTVFRTAFQAQMVALLTNTFINDYVVSEDRGKATSV